MNTDSKNIINLNLRKDEKVLNFSDFQKQNIKFDITKLQDAYKQIIQTKYIILRNVQTTMVVTAEG